MKPTDIANAVINQGEKLGASDTSVIVIEENRQMIRFSNNSISVVKAWNTIIPIILLSIGPRRTGCAIEDSNPESITTTMKTLIKTMKLMKPGEVDSRIPQGPFNYTTIKGNYDSTISSSKNKLISVVERTINSAIDAGARRVSGILMATDWGRTLRTSTESEGREKGTLLELTVRAFVDSDSSGQGISCSSNFSELNPESAGREAGEIAKLAERPREGKEGLYRVILAPSVMANLLNTTAMSASAYSIEIGMSYLTEELGKCVASNDFTLIDDQQSPGPGSHAFDDEGYPTKPTTIIDNGILKSLLHSSYTAKKFNANLTGHAYYSGSSGIIPSPSNLIVKAGCYSKEELFSEVKDGLYITNNWYTRFQNYRTGDFSTICRDGVFAISNGEISHPVRGLRISDRMPRILQSINAISNERKWIKWWEVDVPILLSHFLLDKIQLTKSTR